MNTAEFWASAAAAAAVAVILGEIIDVAAWLAPRIVRHAAAQMPTPELQDRYLEEWLSEIAQLDGLKLVKLTKSITLWANSWRISNAWQGQAGNGLLPGLSHLVKGIRDASRMAWNGSGYEEESTSHIFERASLCMLLIGNPTNISMGLIIRDSGDGDGTLCIRPRYGTVNRHATWLAPFGRILAVLFYDIYLLRRGTAFKQIMHSHAETYRSIWFPLPEDWHPDADSDEPLTPTRPRA
ncbi:MAG: hypothetical protein J2P25_04190 [Nocardiopsaceae bacterium]|nr:hypothetical protein [Nocardiopsaceae bacterium]